MVDKKGGLRRGWPQPSAGQNSDTDCPSFRPSIYVAAIEAWMERVLATGITIFFRPCPSLLTDTTFSNPSADDLDTSRDTAVGLRREALAKTAIEYRPSSKNYTTTAQGRMAQYVYRIGSNYSFYYFQNGILTTIQN